MGQLLNRVGDLVTTETGKYSTSSLPFPQATSSRQGSRKEKCPSVDDDLVRNCITELDPYKSMGSDL